MSQCVNVAAVQLDGEFDRGRSFGSQEGRNLFSVGGARTEGRRRREGGAVLWRREGKEQLTKY